MQSIIENNVGEENDEVEEPFMKTTIATQPSFEFENNEEIQSEVEQEEYAEPDQEVEDADGEVDVGLAEVGVAVLTLFALEPLVVPR